MKSPLEKHAAKAVERFVFFSDAVFAFALTLLATTVKLPATGTLKSNAAVLAAIRESLPALSCYLISFLVVSSLWIRHHRIFEKLENYDKALIRLNFLLLLFVSLVPFGVDVYVAGHGAMLSIEVYLATLSLCGLGSFGVWWYTRRTPGLLASPLSAEAFQLELFDNVDLPLVGVTLTVALPFVSLPTAGYLMAGLGIGTTLGRRWLKRRVRLQPGAAV